MRTPRLFAAFLSLVSYCSTNLFLQASLIFQRDGFSVSDIFQGSMTNGEGSTLDKVWA